MRFPMSPAMIAVVFLLGCAVQSSSGEKQPGVNCSGAGQKPTKLVAGLTGPPTIKNALYHLGDVFTISAEVATTPDHLYAELTRNGSLKTVKLQFAPPATNENIGTVHSLMTDDLEFGRWTAELFWGTARFPVGSFEIHPPGASGLKLTKLGRVHTTNPLIGAVRSRLGQSRREVNRS